MTEHVKYNMDDEGSRFSLNPYDSAIKILRDKLAYHKARMEFHQKEWEKTNAFIEASEKFGLGLSDPTTVGGAKFYGGGEVIFVPSADERKSKSFWSKVAIDYIQKCNTLVKTSDIYNSVKLSVSSSERRAIMSIISLVVAVLCTEGKLVRHKEKGSKGFYYGTPEMFNGEMPIVEY